MENKNQSLRESIFNNCLSGGEFENRIVDFLEGMGFKATKTGSNDCGVDIIARIHIQDVDYCFLIQCKFYNTPLGKGPINEVSSGSIYYAKLGTVGTPVVITNNHVTPEARIYAKVLGVQIIADLEWAEMDSVFTARRIINPVQYTGLVGMIIATFAKDRSYFQAAVAKEDIDKKIGKDELAQLTTEINSEFDEEEECLREQAYHEQQAANYRMRAFQVRKKRTKQIIKFGEFG